MLARRIALRTLLATAATSGLGGCALPLRLASLPANLRTNRPFEGLPDDTRVMLDGKDNQVLSTIAVDSVRREAAAEPETGRPLEPSNFLALSGGGADGAFGAGVLTGWSTLGTRPSFKCVTGVSTGALAAPFAFLGSAYDGPLERIYTTIGESDVFVSRGILTALFSDSLYDTSPLRRLIQSYLTPDLIEQIGLEYANKGRLLFVATTDLDVPVGVLWNIGAIAASRHPRSGELITDVLLASAAIPGAFPPVMIDIDVNGNRYQEMHVDGGTVSQVVVYPPSLSIKSDDLPVLRRIAGRRRHLYIIRNSRLGSSLETVDRSTVRIAGRAVSTLISTQGIADLYELYVLCQRDRIDYNVLYISDEFTLKSKGLFDRSYMNALYRFGREKIEKQDAWSKYPPGYNPTPLSGVRRG